MEERKDHIKRLVREWMDDTITREGKEQLVTLLNERNLLPDVELAFQEAWNAQSHESVFSEDETALMIDRILSRYRQVHVHRVHFMRRWGWVAASILILMSAGIYFWTLNMNKPPRQTTVAQLPINEVMPAKGNVVLKLADGKQLLLDSAQGSIVKEGYLTVNNEKGALEYKGTADKIEYHTLTTQSGRQYKLQLPDSTNVWLNAASSITFPTAFTGSERQVTISGEVYFEVAKNQSKPFRVAADNMLITVTGTHFNVKTYADEPLFTTTVLEGGVKVSRNNKTVTLSPNEQALSYANGSLSVNTNLNISEIMAWRQGLFHFESADLPTILRELGRWYDLEVSYEGTISKDKFFVIVNRNSSLSTILKALQSNGVEFSISGKRLSVKFSQ